MGVQRAAKTLWQGADTSGLRKPPKQELDPETQESLARSIESAQSLRRAPLLSQGRAEIAGDEAIRQQARAMGGTPESEHYVRQQGAGLGAKVIGQYGQPMAQEATDKYAEGLRVAQAGQMLSRGQVLHHLAERIKNYLVANGVNVAHSQALVLAGSTALAHGLSLFGDSGDGGGGGGSGGGSSDGSLGQGGLADQFARRSPPPPAI